MSITTSRISSRIWRLLGIFFLALIVRLFYNLYIAQHRICDIGDSYYYLCAGRSLARLVRESQSLPTFLTQLCAAAQFVPGSFNSFSSLALSDRLLIDGPIYPSYLAAVFLLCSKALTTGALNVHQMIFGIANSVVDALLAAAILFLGEIAFGVAAGILAGVLWCFYLPAVINTQQCYGEPVVALILTLFVGGLIYQAKIEDDDDDAGQTKTALCKRSKIVVSLLLGVLAGLVMLAKPAFVLLPPILVALHLIALSYSGRLRRAPYSAASLFLGVVLSITPWLLYTSTVSGAPRLIVNRAPGYNLYIGNYLPTDGWKTWPVVAGVPDAVADARKFIESEAERQPLALASLLLRKVPRLWAGVWNDFHTAAFGFSYNIQNALQAVYLLLSVLALTIFCSGKLRGVRPLSFAAASTIAWAIAFHFIYVLFEPVPRYAFTAMPLVVVLASGGLIAFIRALLAVPNKNLRVRISWQYLFLILLFGLFAELTYKFWSPVDLFLSLTKDDHALRVYSAGLLFTVFALFCFGFLRILRRVGFSGPFSVWLNIKSFGLAALIAVAGALSDPAYLETYVDVGSKKNEAICAQLTLPDLGKSVPGVVYLLIDAQSAAGAPKLMLQVNSGTSHSVCGLPLYELTAAAKDIPTLLNLQARMMDADQRTFRQWWIFAIDAKDLKFGASNNFTVFCDGDKANLRLFADYSAPRSEGREMGGETISQPSLTSFSWSKGFLTADCRDPRVYEDTYYRGQAGRFRNVMRYTDCPGTLRMRVAVPMVNAGASTIAASAPDRLASLPLIERVEECAVTGTDPRSLTMVSNLIKLEQDLAPASRLHFKAKMRTNRKMIPATVAASLTFTQNKPEYSSIWQPSSLRVNGDWTDVEFITILPADTKDWRQFTAHLLLAPYPSDRFYMHRKEALKDVLYVKDLRLEILPPLLPGGRPSGVLKLL